MRYIQSFSTSGDVQTAIDNGYLGKPYVALVNGSLDWNSQTPTDFSAEYLTLDIISGGTISFKCNNANSSYVKTMQYRVNDGEWTSITSNKDNPPSFSVSAGDKVKLKGSNNTYCNSSLRWNGLSGSTAYFNVCGNIMSLIYGDNFSGQTSLPNDEGTFTCFFNKTNVVSAHNLILPATTLAKGCYKSMFSNCTGLTTAPALPATTLPDVSSSLYGCYERMFNGCSSLTTAPELPALTLTQNCYKEMFNGCSSLTTAPELPATTLANRCYGGMFGNCSGLTRVPADYLPVTTLAESCYSYMFQGCTSLTTTPELPATTLVDGCYGGMFNGCSSLTTAPSLPATTLAERCYGGMFEGCSGLTIVPADYLPVTTLANRCYSYMFYGCTSLTQAPELPATTLAEECYNYMFCNCSSLNYIKCLATDISATSCTQSWLFNVAATGTFVKDANMSSWTTGNDGIPSGWTVQDAE